MALTRRRFLQASVSGLTAAVLAPRLQAESIQTQTLRIALLHLAPVPGDVAHNRRLIEKAVTTAAGLGAAWITTPELMICGYSFADAIGTEWILPQPDPWMTAFCRLVAQFQVTVFLSHPERDRQSNKLHNTLFVIAPDGAILGKHRKINTLKIGSESWSSPGERVTTIAVPPFNNVGLLICADAYSLGNCTSLQAQGAQLLVSAAAWAPGLHGPNGEWERCTEETGLPLLVCNRTGPDRTLDFTRGESVVVKDGKRLLSFSSDRSAIVVIDWNLRTQNLATPEYQAVYV
ncbi:MAG: carbon-nitrogen hydrolase family protein [Nitrospiraceae bacterium]